MRRFVKTFIDLESFIYWLIKSDDMSKTISTYDKVKRLFENDILERKNKAAQTISAIDGYSTLKGIINRIKVNDPIFEKPLKETDYGKVS